MKKPGYVPLFFFVASLVACTAQNVVTAPPSTLSDAIPTDTPLPQAGVNRRVVTGVKTALLVAAHWPGDRELDMQQLFDSSFSAKPRSLSDYLLKASGGKLILKGTTISARFTDPVPPEGFWGETREAEKAARAQGYEPDQYDYFFVVHNNGIGGAQGTMPGRNIVIRDQPYAGHYLFAHEFGHNLGYSHENQYGGLFDTYVGCPTNGASIVAPLGCNTKRYGDSGDPVQGSKSVQALFPANNRWYAGWLDTTQEAEITHTGLYRLGVLGGAGPQLYLIDRHRTNATEPKQIALEFRQPGPPYDNFAANDNRVTGVWLRYTTMAGRVDNVQLDATPETASTDDPTLQPGRTLIDVEAKLTIKVCSSDTQGATIAVAVNDQALPTCTPVLPFAFISEPTLHQRVGYKPFISGSGLPGATVLVEKIQDGHMRGAVGTAIVRADGQWSTQIDQALPAGEQRLAAYLINPGSQNGAGGYSQPFTVIEIPEQPTLQVPGPGGQTTSFPTFSGTGLPGATVYVALFVNGHPLHDFASALVDQDGHWSTQSTTSFGRGSFTVTFYQRNGDKQSPGYPTRTFTVVDTPVPAREKAGRP